jgi:hypothetical protein
MVSRRIVGAIASPPTDGTLTLDPSPSGRGKKLGVLGGKADFGKAQEDESKDRRRVFLGLEPGVGAKLVSRIPEAFFECFGPRVFFRGGNPLHTRIVVSSSLHVNLALFTHPGTLIPAPAARTVFGAIQPPSAADHPHAPTGAGNARKGQP